MADNAKPSTSSESSKKKTTKETDTDTDNRSSNNEKVSMIEIFEEYYAYITTNILTKILHLTDFNHGKVPQIFEQFIRKFFQFRESENSIGRMDQYC